MCLHTSESLTGWILRPFAAWGYCVLLDRAASFTPLDMFLRVLFTSRGDFLTSKLWSQREVASRKQLCTPGWLYFFSYPEKYAKIHLPQPAFNCPVPESCKSPAWLMPAASVWLNGFSSSCQSSHPFGWCEVPDGPCVVLILMRTIGFLRGL